jgi:hypothetical protein
LSAPNCWAPSVYVENGRLRSMFGEVAELFIQKHYCKNWIGGCQPFDPQLPVGSQVDYFDGFRGPQRCSDLAEYIHLHNSWIDPVAIAEECQSKKTDLKYFPVPDIIKHTPEDLRNGQYYEIKPLSDSGTAAAKQKVTWFTRVCQKYSLPYKPGIAYKPAGGKVDGSEKRVFTDMWFLLPPEGHGLTRVEVFFRWRWTMPGVIQYNLCVETDKATSETVNEWAIRATVATLLCLATVATSGGLEVLIPALLSAVNSPLTESVGPPDGQPLVGTNPRSFLYSMFHVWRKQARAGLAPPFALWGPVKPGSDPEEPMAWDDPPPFEWDRQTREYLASLGLDGRFDPGGEAIRKLEEEEMLWLCHKALELPDNEEILGCIGDGTITDEEGEDSGDALDPHELVTAAFEDYLWTFSDEALRWAGIEPPAR